jgi:hypothetical protein
MPSCVGGGHGREHCRKSDRQMKDEAVTDGSAALHHAVTKEE